MYSLHTQTLLSRGDVLVFYNFFMENVVWSRF